MPDKKNKISVLFFAKDEIDIFNQALMAVKKSGLADELVVVLDDRYVQKVRGIASNYTSNIIIRRFDNFRDHKNFGISLTKNNWVLLLDSDEIIDSELIAAIKKEIYQPIFGHFSAYLISSKTFFFGRWLKHSGVYPDKHARFFNRGKCHYQSIIHEVLKVDGPVGELAGHIEHYSFRSRSQRATKTDLYTTLEARKLFQVGRKFGLVYAYGKPLKEWYTRYVTNKGFLDGRDGLAYAWLGAQYRYQVAQKLKKLEEEN